MFSKIFKLTNFTFFFVLNKQQHIPGIHRVSTDIFRFDTSPYMRKRSFPIGQASHKNAVKRENLLSASRQPVHLTSLHIGYNIFDFLDQNKAEVDSKNVADDGNHSFSSRDKGTMRNRHPGHHRTLNQTIET